MGDTWITDLTDLLDAEGQIPARGAGSRIANHLTAIVQAVTERPSASPQGTSVRCRRRPKRKPCPGAIHAGFDSETASIHWFCPVCGDKGWIRRWQDTRWDKGGRVGLPRIDKIIYRHGLTDDIESEQGLEQIILEGTGITDDIVRSIHDNGLIGASGIYGDPTVGDPLQVDHLVIVHGPSSTRITLYNRAIMLFTKTDEYYVQVHRVCCKITEHGITGSGRNGIQSAPDNTD